MEKVIKKRSFGGAPGIDFMDLSYSMPLMSAAALKEKPDFPFSYGGNLKLQADLSHYMGRLPRWMVYEKYVSSMMVNRHEAEDVDSEKYARWVTKQYEGKKYQYVVIGPTLGSLVYLSSILEAPYLPLSYSMAIRHEKLHPDNVKEHVEIAKKRADYFLKKDDNINIVHEYDPIHQRFRIKHGTLLRFKYLSLPEAYKKFIRTHLVPNGTIIFVESRVGWRQFILGDRLFHQVGRPGGIPCEEYLSGSKRIEKFLENFLQEEKSYVINTRHELLPESCYGITPGNRHDIVSTANLLERNLCQIFTADIYQLNKLVANLFLLCARREGRRPKYCYVQSGAYLSPYWCMQSMIIPIWVSTPCFQALQFVSEFVKTYPFELEETLLSFEPSMEDAPDFVMLDRWKEALGDKTKIRYIGMNPKKYPKDMSSYFKYWPDLSKWARRRKEPMDMRVTIRNIIDEADSCDIKFKITENK